jgi:hypothetical protein
MYAKRVTEAVELAKARAGAIMAQKAPAEAIRTEREDEAAKRELADAAARRSE